MKEFKYYMNTPCEVIRKISDDFSEVKVYPKFRDDLEGSQWCTECMVGNSGTPQRHTCDEYWDVINALEDVENYILCIVESRLLANEPIEFKKIKALDKLIEEKNKIITDKSRAISEMDTLLINNNKILEEQNLIIDRTKEVLKDLDIQVMDWSNKLKSVRKEYTYSFPKNINVSIEKYKDLVKRDFILTKLEQGGVDNWEWYSESYPSDEDLDSLI